MADYMVFLDGTAMPIHIPVVPLGPDASPKESDKFTGSDYAGIVVPVQFQFRVVAFQKCFLEMAPLLN
jgi:hypothetical protein